MAVRSVPQRKRPILPTTRPGRWAVGLAVAHVLLVLAWSILAGGAGLGFVVGLAAAAVALYAIVRREERALTVFAALLPGLSVVFFVLAELLIGHD